jgi:hypothetical protein
LQLNRLHGVIAQKMILFELGRVWEEPRGIIEIISRYFAWSDFGKRRKISE